MCFISIQCFFKRMFHPRISPHLNRGTSNAFSAFMLGGAGHCLTRVCLEGKKSSHLAGALIKLIHPKNLNLNWSIGIGIIIPERGKHSKNVAPPTSDQPACGTECKIICWLRPRVRCNEESDIRRPQPFAGGARPRKSGVQH